MHSSNNIESIEEVTSPEAWGSSSENACQVNVDEKERFRDLKAQKSLNTISSSSAYFRREELLRYSIPDKAFSYTAADLLP
ncbi:hypothetical protein V6N13_039614 [Hibiscus sabdariffa]